MKTPEEKAAYQREYRAKNKEALLKKRKKYYAQKKYDIQAQQKGYREVNKSRIHQYYIAYINERKKSDPSFRVMERVRSRIKNVLRGQDAKKIPGSYNDLIGCSTEFLLKHLQETAINNGYIDFDINTYDASHYHIDHIIPCATFDLSQPKAQRECFHWSNLQILEAKTNMEKGMKLLESVVGQKEDKFSKPIQFD